MQPQYFARDGRQLTEEEALKNGILRDGVIKRVRMNDGRVPAVPRFSDADFQLNRPGFRTASSDLLGDHRARDDRREAYRDYENSLLNAYKKPARATDAAVEEDDGNDDEVACARCQGTGEVGNGITCPVCAGEGSLPGDDAMRHSATRSERENSTDRRTDRRTVQQKMRDHKANMDRIYQDHARELEQAWRK
jgi:hypothetical protein